MEMDNKLNALVEQWKEINSFINKLDVVLLGYREYENMLPYSPTTLKKDKNKMARCTDGIMQVIDGTLQYVEL